MQTGSSIQGFDGPDAFAAQIQNTHGRVRPGRKGAYAARLTMVRLTHLNLAMAQESQGRRFVCQVAPGRAFFRLKHFGDPPGIRNGCEEIAGTVQVNRRASEVDDRTPGPTLWRSLSVPMEELAMRADVLAGRAVLPLLDEAAPLRPEPTAFQRLAALQRDTLRLAARDPAVLAHPGAAAALDATIGEALIGMLVSAMPRSDGAAARNAQAILRRVTAFIAENQARPVALAELCAAGRCSARTLETVFREAFGTTPNRHLRLRRLWLARRMLRAPASRHATVARIALDCGFWELGRFAVAYREAFGESPSQTLQAGRAASR